MGRLKKRRKEGYREKERRECQLRRWRSAKDLHIWRIRLLPVPYFFFSYRQRRAAAAALYIYSIPFFFQPGDAARGRILPLRLR